MFQFPGLPLPVLCVQTGVTRHDPCQVSPFGHPRINARLAATRGLSQPPTSFIGFWRLGIHHVPFVTWQHRKDARARYAVLKVPDPSRPARLAGRAGWFGQVGGSQSGALATSRSVSAPGTRSARADARTLPQSSTVCAAVYGSLPGSTAPRAGPVLETAVRHATE
jgi:hypothetical protein